MTEIIKYADGYAVAIDGKPYAKILPAAGATDTFTPIEDGAWKWHRHTDAPVDHMRMEMVLLGEATFTMVPSVSYNGNGWGSLAEYVGDRAEDGTPWSWASHRVTIPACTYSENDAISVALMAEANVNSACSLYKVEEGEKHVVIYPEEEQPKTLQRHFWGDAFQGTMEPTSDFEAIILAIPSDGTKHRYNGLLDFAFRYYGHDFDAPMTAKELYRLSIAYCRFLYQKEKDGFAGFTMGSQWHPSVTCYKKTEHRYEIGWVGQSASLPLFPPKKERLCSMESLILENGSASGLIESYNTYKSVKMNVDNLFSSLLSGTSSPEYAVKLIGLGRGLTPSGDDFLAGMFSLFFAAEKCGIKVPAALCDYALAVRENIGRTSKISGAYLLSVLDKKRFSLYENACLALLGEGDAASFANEVLPLGASSGTDTLCGALFAAKVIERI
ncbi:MAG: DUF2877 domain-containing protein, partial [Clostridia bacterium]|nr:DUF2877 domain-containing protein [Clostridia bacterium]